MNPEDQINSKADMHSVLQRIKKKYMAGVIFSLSLFGLVV